MITPTVGRVVWFQPNGARMPNHFTYHQGGGQPCKADIAYVHGDRMVNLLVVDHNGVTMPMTSVKLVQDGDTLPPEGQPYCMWMPYQKGQAAKTEELQRQIGAAASDIAKDAQHIQPPPNPPAERRPEPSEKERGPDAQG